VLDPGSADARPLAEPAYRRSHQALRVAEQHSRPSAATNLGAVQQPGLGDAYSCTRLSAVASDDHRFSCDGGFRSAIALALVDLSSAAATAVRLPTEAITPSSRLL
jgi:hypothetical protein